MSSHLNTEEMVQLLTTARRIAVVGASDKPNRPSHGVPERMIAFGYDIVPVNPAATTVLGRTSYPTLADVPGHIDIVDVFRPSEATPDIIDQAIAVGAGAVWLQLGIASDESAARAERANMPYVEDTCILSFTDEHGIRVTHDPAVHDRPPQ